MNRFAAWTLIVGLVLGQAALAAAEEPLDAFPAETGVLLRIASIERLAGGFNEMTAGLGQTAAPAAAGFEQGLAEMFEVKADPSAIDRSAPAFVAIFPILEERQPLAYLVSTADENKLRHAVLKSGGESDLVIEKTESGFDKITHEGRTWFFGGRGDRVLYTSSEAVVKLLADHESSRLGSIIEPRAAELLAGGDGALFVNAARLHEAFGEQINQGRQRILNSIESLPDQALGSSGADPKSIRKLYSDMANLAFDSAADAVWAGGNVDFSAEGAAVNGLLGVKEGSGTDTLLAASPPVPFETLGLLPAGARAYVGFHWNYEQLSRWSQEFLKLAYAGGAEKTEALQASLEAMGQAGAGPVVSSFSLPSGGASMVVSLLQQADDPEALRQANGAYQAAIGEVNTPVYNQTIEYKTAAETYKERPIDLLVQRVQLANAADPGVAIGQQFVQKLFGGDAVQTRIAVVEGLFVQTTSNDSKHIHQVLDGLESGEGVLGLQEPFAQTRDHLAESANLILLINFPQLVLDGVAMVRDIPPFGMLLAQAPFNFGATPAESYAGVSLGTEPQGLRLRVFVPVGQPKGFLQIFAPGI